MKRSVIAQFSQISTCKFIIAILFISPAFKTNATEFIDILRMTADHPSIQSAVSSASAAYFDIEQAKAGNSLQLSAGLSSTAYSGQPGYENNLIAPHISISKVLYDHGRTDDTVQGKEAAFSMQRAQVMATRETLNQQALTLFTSAVTNAKVVAILDQEIATSTIHAQVAADTRQNIRLADEKDIEAFKKAVEAKSASTRTPLIASESQLQQSAFIPKSQKETNVAQNALHAWP